MANFRLPSIPLLLSIAYFCASSICTPIDSVAGPHTVDDTSDLLRRQDGIFSVLGIAGLGDSTIYPRLEIRDLEKNHPDQWNIFLLGLQRFQAISQDDKLSYFQIAGIHGRPFVPWDGVKGDDYYWSRYSGYCTHDSNIFPTWHRPFLALFEEVLYLNCRETVSALPNGELKERYLKALPSLRLPYWDWAAIPPEEEGTLPASVQAEFVNVTMPNGTVTITNPLHSYKFHPLPDWVSEGEERWKEFPSTVRGPTTADKNAQSNNTKAAQALQENRSSMQARVYNLLAMQHSYLNMSTKLIPGDSMESIHGTIHDGIGQDGSMTWLFYSAFDPSFWLHHCNVDRLLAMWQALNPDEWVENFTTPSPTFYSPANFNVNGSTALKPFHKDDSGNFWTSDSIRDHTIFGYTYPDLLDLPSNSTRSFLNARGVSTSLIARVNALYGPNASPLQSPELRDPKLLARGIATTGAPHFAGKRQYSLEITVREFRDAGSLSVYAFFGSPKGDVEGWVRDKGFVGTASFLGASKKASQRAHSVIPLTPALEAKARSGDLATLGEEDVAEYLRNVLRWRVVQVSCGFSPQGSRGWDNRTDGVQQQNVDLTDCETEKAPGLEVAVTWQEIEPALSMDEFPKTAGEVKDLLCADGNKRGHFK
ncbi:Di-copper centre-containing protein [Paraphaeosphaeria sporulosa]|uniref:tyrosinase n=1 Tax=Paraphaeosphaeria sporulosa TaxID=1460663 RepID=A0A177CUZ4_9PLEO|nr:Di-copper centre-containing protein [Paraphaeosphaeria sporulosa]OAG11374.1 Di-copper centre-containing protein [Paraphaeosphaeria sporulosa]